MSIIINKATNQFVLDHIDRNKDKYIQISHYIHSNPEEGGKEYFASQLLIDLLHSEGFQIQKGISTYDTAFMARKKGETPGRKIAFIAEYSAFPKKGHISGQNIVCATSIAAAIALSKVIDYVGGEIVVFGTPGEKDGSYNNSKATFVKEGLFEDIDAAIMIYPSTKTSLTSSTFCANTLEIEYFSEQSNSCLLSEENINALDGVIQLFNGIHQLKDKLPRSAQVQGIITKGGEIPNIVPESAKAKFIIQAETKCLLDEITKEVKSLAQISSTKTRTQVLIQKSKNQIDPLMINNHFDYLFQSIIEDFGEIVDGREEKANRLTDLGNVSQIVPTIQPTIKIGTGEVAPYTEQFKELAQSEQGSYAIVLGAKAIALTMLEILTNDYVYEKVSEEFYLKKSK